MPKYEYDDAGDLEGDSLGHMHSLRTHRSSVSYRAGRRTPAKPKSVSRTEEKGSRLKLRRPFMSVDQVKLNTNIDTVDVTEFAADDITRLSQDLGITILSAGRAKAIYRMHHENHNDGLGMGKFMSKIHKYGKEINRAKPNLMVEFGEWAVYTSSRKGSKLHYVSNTLTPKYDQPILDQERERIVARLIPENQRSKFNYQDGSTTPHMSVFCTQSIMVATQLVERLNDQELLQGTTALLQSV